MAAEAFFGPTDGQIRVRTLGSLDLRAPDGTQIEAVLRQPKRLALLLYLTLNGPVFHRRDRLLLLFWPESDERSARGSLNQAVFQLRAALGRDVIVNRGDDEIAVQPGLIWCDAVTFKRAVNEREPEMAMTLYEGELLPGFIVDEASEFEQWLADERRRLLEDAVAACGELTDAAEVRGGQREAVRWARRAVSLQPYNESAQRRLIEVLDRSGDRAGALRAFDEFCTLLRNDFEAEPAAETLELVRAIRSRADAQFSPVRDPVRSAYSAVPPAAHLKARSRQTRLIIALASLTLILATLVWGAMAMRAPQPYRAPADRVAVLYFNDESPDGQLGYLAESLTTTLIEQLGQVHKLQVISQNGVRAFRGDTLPLDSIARVLDVGTLVGGSITRSNDRLRVTVEMIDGATGLILRTKKLERPLGELFGLLDDVSDEVSAALRTTVGQEVKLREWQADTRDVEAWRTLQQAEYLRGRAEELEESGAMADSWAMLTRADSFAVRALALDRRFASAQVLRGTIAEKRAWLALLLPEKEPPAAYLGTAREHASLAIKLNPENASAYELRGKTELWSFMLSAPGAVQSNAALEAAEADLRKAIELGDRPRAQSVLSMALQFQGKFAESRTAAQRALEADAYLADADQIVIRLFDTSFETGDDGEAGRWCDQVRRRNAGKWPSAYCDLILLGWGRGSADPRKALHLLENFGSADAEAVRAAMRPRMMVLTAAVLARAGSRDSAAAMLESARRAAPRDVELLHLEAATRALMNDDARAVALLQEYLKINPTARARVSNSRMFARLRERIS